VKPIRWTYTDALRLLKKAVADKGEDYKYESVGGHYHCQYFDQGQPSCIVGHALAADGVTEQDLREADPSRHLNLVDVGTLAKRGLLEMDDATQKLLGTVQDEQDCGTPWGEALRIAQQAVEDSE